MTDQPPTLAQIAADKSHPNCTTADHKLLAQATGLEELMHFLLLASKHALKERQDEEEAQRRLKQQQQPRAPPPSSLSQ